MEQGSYGFLRQGECHNFVGTYALAPKAARDNRRYKLLAVHAVAAQNRTGEDIEALRRAYARHVAVVREGGDEPVWRSADEDFHVIIARASRNPMLIRLRTEDFYQLVRFYRSHLVHIRGRGDRTVGEPRRILEAIEDRDGDLAEPQIRRHIVAARDQLSAALKHQNGSVA